MQKSEHHDFDTVCCKSDNYKRNLINIDIIREEGVDLYKEEEEEEEEEEEDCVKLAQLTHHEKNAAWYVGSHILVDSMRTSL